MAGGSVWSTLRSVFIVKVAGTVLLMGAIPLLVLIVDASSFAIGVVRLTWALALTMLFLFSRIRWHAFRNIEGDRAILLAIGVLFGLHWVTYFEAIQRSSATLGVLALSTYGIHVTWMGALFSDRRPSKRDWVSVLVAAGGAYICVPEPDVAPGAFVGFLLGLVSGLCYAALPLLHQRAVHINHPTRGAAQFLFAWLLFLPFAPFQDWGLAPRDWVILAVLGIFCTFVAHNLWISITTEVRPSTSGLLYYLALPVTMTLEALVLSKPPSQNQLVGAALIVGGNASVLLSQRQKQLPEHA